MNMPSVSSIVVVVALSISVDLSAAFGSNVNIPADVARTSRHHSIRNRRRIKHLFLSNADPGGGDDDESQQQPPKKHLYASQKARRDEEARRRDRLSEGFATPGVSSAVPGARDFAIDVARTEEEYWQSLSSSDDGGVIDEYNVDKYVAIWTEEGLTRLRMMRFEEAAESFRKVYEIKPEAYLWQDGLLKYYLGDYHSAAESLAKNAVRYETRFMESASEERIWRDAAELKILNSLKGGRKMKNTDIPVAMRVPLEEGMDEAQGEKENIAQERRKVIRLARQLFSSSLRDNAAGVALARAQLQAMCGDAFPPSLKSTLPTMPKSEQGPKSSSAVRSRPDRKMYRLHSLFYLGLHYDALGQSYESKQCMKMALKRCAESIGGNNQDITYLLPMIHMTIRDWYDDDEFDLDEDGETPDLAGDYLVAELVNSGGVELMLEEECEDGTTSSAENVRGDRREKTERHLRESIKDTRIIDLKGELMNRETERRLRESIKDMRIIDLKGELKKRKLRVSGSKRELQDRLVDDLKKDVGAA